MQIFKHKKINLQYKYLIRIIFKYLIMLLSIYFITFKFYDAMVES